MSHVEGSGQSSSLKHRIVHRNKLPNGTHFASLGGAKPQAASLGAAPFAQSFELNWFFAGHVLTRSEQTSTVSSSILSARLRVFTYGRPAAAQSAGAPLAVSPFFQTQ